MAYEIGGNVDATRYGGIAAVHRLVTKLGLPGLVNEQVPLLKVHLPYQPNHPDRRASMIVNAKQPPETVNAY